MIIDNILTCNYSTVVEKFKVKCNIIYVNHSMYNTARKILFVIAVMMLHPFMLLAAGTDTTRIYFKLDDPNLNKKEKQKIDSLLYHDIINASHEILIVGYADHLGTGGYNDTLSANRARNVKTYLQEMGIPGKQVSYCVGKGEVSRDVELPDGYAADRRVDIVNITGKGKGKQPTTTTATKKKTKEPVVTIESKDAVVFNSTTPFQPEKVKEGQLFVLDKIFFHTGRHIIIEESLKELENLFKVLDENDNLHVRIEGHVCCVPPTTDALDIDTGEIALSVNRARYIYSYLIKKGIEKDRLSFVGYGKSKPLSRREYTMEEQNMNKRVEMRIVKK